MLIVVEKLLTGFDTPNTKVLDAFINVGKINKLTELVNIFDSKFDKEVMKIEGKSAKAQQLKNIIISGMKPNNNAYPKEFENKNF